MLNYFKLHNMLVIPFTLWVEIGYLLRLLYGFCVKEMEMFERKLGDGVKTFSINKKGYQIVTNFEKYIRQRTFH